MKSVVWMVPSAVVMLAFVLLVGLARERRNASEQFAFRAERAALVSRMQQGLSAASEAGQRAVLSTSDRDVRAFAEEARNAEAEVERERHELEGLSNSGGSERERELLGHFSEAFAEFQHVDSDLLKLVVMSTNRKATELSFGPLAQALQEMHDALSRFVAANAGTEGAPVIAETALRAENAALRMDVLIAPHIAEASDAEMDKLEASMAKEDAVAHEAFDTLRARAKLRNVADLALAAADYTKFNAVRTEILTLSRQNTNVRSNALSLHEKRAASVRCQDALGALREIILEQRVEAARPPVSPR